MFSGLLTGQLQADTPGDPYSIDLGPQNEEIEQAINSAPWVPVPGTKNLRAKDLSSISFKGRDFSGAVIRLELNALMNANFEGCRLDGCSFREVMFLNCSFRNASLRYGEFDGLAGIANATNDLSNADITGSWIWYFDKRHLLQTKNYQNKSLTGMNLKGDFHNLDLKGFLLTGTALRGDLANISLDNANFIRSSVPNEIDFASFQTTRNYQEKDLSQLLFSQFGKDKNFAWQFSGCSLGYFYFCDLRSVDFRDAFFVPQIANFVKYLRPGEQYSTARLYTTASVGALGFDSCQVDQMQLQQLKNWRRKNIRTLALRNMDLSSWDFSDFQMAGVDLSGSNVESTRFQDAELFSAAIGVSSRVKFDNCVGLTVGQLLESETFKGRTRKDVIIQYYAKVKFEDLTIEEEGLIRQLKNADRLRRIKVISNERY